MQIGFLRNINKSIAKQLNFLLFSQLSIILIIISIYFIFDKKQKNNNLYINTIKSLNYQIQNLTNIEDQIRIYRTKSSNFYTSKAAESKKEILSLEQEIVYHLNVLKTARVFNDENTIKIIKQTEELTRKRKELNDSLINALLNKGWKDYGTIGLMRNAIHKLEYKHYMKGTDKMLMIRRHEKDFLLRKQENYIKKHKNACAELRDFIHKDFDLSNKRKKDLITYLNHYEKKFQEMVKWEKYIGLNSDSGINLKINQNSETLTNSLSKLSDIVLQQAEQSEKIINWIFILVFISSLLLTGLGIWLPIKNIARPIEKLDKSMQMIIDNNFKQNEKISTTSLNNEIGYISTRFQNLLDKFHKHNIIIKEQRDELELSFENLKKLSKIGLKITSELDFDAIITYTRKKLSLLIPFNHFAIGLIDEPKTNINFYGINGTEKPKKLYSETVNNIENLSAYCYNNQKKVEMNNVKTEYFEYLPKLNITNIKSVSSTIWLPITIKNKRKGVVYIGHEEPNQYNKFHLNVLRNIALYLGIALENIDTIENINKQKEQIEIQNKNIKASINYAKTIQNSFLPHHNLINSIASNFIIYKPKDIVSGDFYWTLTTYEPTSNLEYTFLAVVDCTGHGVPGAFMSTIGTRLLNEIVFHRKIYSTSAILEYLDEELQKVLNQENGTNNDGMDLCLIRIESDMDDTYNIMFSGAKRPLYHFNHTTKKLIAHQGTRRSIGGKQRRVRQLMPFEYIKTKITRDDRLFLSTDGFADQPNEKRKKYTSAMLKDVLEISSEISIDKQKEVLEYELKEHSGNQEQRDDITIIGLHFVN